MDDEIFRRKLLDAMDQVDQRKKFQPGKWMALFGLIISIVGTAIIWIDSQTVVKGISEIALEIVEPVGVWKDVLVDEFRIDDFVQNFTEASSLDIKGFALLMVGFLMQIFGMIYQ